MEKPMTHAAKHVYAQKDVLKSFPVFCDAKRQLLTKNDFIESLDSTWTDEGPVRRYSERGSFFKISGSLNPCETATLDVS
jgi:hypothetical protein